jgi:hypothetical protein
VILTPHIGGSTEEAQAAIGREVAASLIRFVNRGTSTGAVNFPQARSRAPQSMQCKSQCLPAWHGGQEGSLHGQCAANLHACTRRPRFLVGCEDWGEVLYAS